MAAHDSFARTGPNRNMTDIETGYKAFRAGVIAPLSLTSRGFGMEIEITAMVCKTRARTYEVPISYYGRSYEEGKKIGFKDGVMAGLYIFYYNLIKPLTRDGRRYIRDVNRFLEGAQDGSSPGSGGKVNARGSMVPPSPLCYPEQGEVPPGSSTDRNG
jgi:hypothetical protein